MPDYHHRRLPDFSTLLAGHTPRDDLGFASRQLQIWYNNTTEAWSDPAPHAHRESDECFIVLRGQIEVEIEGEHITIGPGEFCCFPRGVYHQVVRVHPPVESFMIRAPSVNDKIYTDTDEQKREKKYMQYSFTPLTEEDVRAIQSWHYEEPYAIYDVGADEGEENIAEEMLDPRSPHYAVRDENGELIGFFGFGSSALVWQSEPGLYDDERCIAIGLGMRPDLTGRGLGPSFVAAGLDFARKAFAPTAFRLFVLAFNERAIKVYEKLGFRRVGVYMQHTQDYGDREFIEMRREA